MKRWLFILPLASALCHGCAHTPITGLAIETALRDARRAGWHRVGDAWLPPDAPLPPEPADRDINQAMAYRAALAELVERRGRSDIEAALTMRPWLIRSAQLGDGLLISGAVAGLGYGIDRLIDSSDGDRTTYRIRADRGSIVQVGSDGASARVGHDIQAEEDE